MRDFITNLLLIGCASAFLVHFGMIAVYGRLYIKETSPVILGLEIAGMVAIILFGIANLINLIRR